MRKVTKKKIQIDKDAVRSLDISELKDISINPQHCDPAGISEYRLYAHLSTFFDKSIILDVGTRTGGSAVAFSNNPTNHVYSYELQEQGASSIEKDNITWKLMDFRNDDTINWNHVSIIMIDVDPHDGLQEVEMMDFLKEKGWSGLLLLDDIDTPLSRELRSASPRLQHCKGNLWPAIEQMWNNIDEPKIDVSEVGHMSGTGIVNFGSKHTVELI